VACGSLPDLNQINALNPHLLMTSDEIQFRAVKLLENNPQISQRELAVELGVSLGKTNYVVQELISLGWLKLGNFRRSNNKLGYAYILTPRGVAEKSALAVRFLARKQAEYDALRGEIEMLKGELNLEDEGSGR